jgi:hypothetical protein
VTKDAALVSARVPRVRHQGLRGLGFLDSGVDGRLQLTPAQLALLIEGIDWRCTVAPDPARRPARV